MQVTNGQSGSYIAPSHPTTEPRRTEDKPRSPKYDSQAGTTRNDPAVRLGGALSGVEGAFDTNGNGSSMQRPPRDGDQVDVSA